MPLIRSKELERLYLLLPASAVLCCCSAVGVNGSSFTFVDALYVPGIKKNLLSVSALARLVLVVKFVDNRCTVHDLSFGDDEIVASGILCRGLYKLTLYDKCV